VAASDDSTPPAADSSGAAPGNSPGSAPSGSSAAPVWAQRLRRRQTMTQGLMIAAHNLRSADHGGGATHISLEDRS